MLKGIKGFKGCLPKDLFKGKIKKLESAVVNMDDSTGPGTHFVAYYNNPKSEYVNYFDSYAVQPPEQIKRYLLTSGKKIAWNTSQYQPIGSVLCGYYCIYVLKELAKGKSFYDVLSIFDMNNLTKNDNFIKRYFQRSTQRGGDVDNNNSDSGLSGLGELIPLALELLI